MLSDNIKEFIKEHTMSHTYHTKDMCGMNNALSVKYLTPEECEMACEMERSEFMRKAHDFFSVHEPDEWVQSLGGLGHFFNKEKFFNDFRKAMEEYTNCDEL